MIQDAKKRFDPGSTDGDRALKVLDEFCEGTPGNTAEFVLDSGSGVVRVVTFQSARMQRSFAAFPEVVLVDSTHDTKSNRYKLFSFAIHDVFGRGQYVQHALVIAEEKPNLAIAVVTFNKNNPAWTKIRVVMTDKAFHEKDGLADAWPKARQLLCKWHVETWLKKQCSRLGGVGMLETKQLKDIMKGLVNAESQQEYDDLKVAFLSTVRDDVDNLLNKSFMTHWDTTTEEWGMFKRGGVPHLKNNTNNRLESKWGRIKEVVDDNFTINQLISMLITLQEYAEERYLAEFHRIGSRPPMAEDPELSALAMHLSEYAVRMVAEQHQLAAGPKSDYDVEVHGEMTKLTNPATGDTHEVNARMSTCDCIFMQTCLLPCRHVMYSRKVSNYETVTPPNQTLATRWIVESPANNIEGGDVLPGGVNRVNCSPIRAQPPINRDTKYMQSKQLSENIINVLSLQPSTTYRLGMKWLSGFHTRCGRGNLKSLLAKGLQTRVVSKPFASLFCWRRHGIPAFLRGSRSGQPTRTEASRKLCRGRGNQCESNDCVRVAAKAEGLNETGGKKR
ncbi:hypothetical protein PF002_g22757 [Phytophthora fragariae]|uniref:ZSWIM1/3 RNaseH-like domain-containing protein n=1 Tax=Phytophthora fragariae TaxID=53985 RepID=A0A6A3X8W4_9STRA|nr:hypothetical protein PF002_g22757 [Phytophthora fragariae]